MSMLELTLNQLAEVTTTALSRKQKPQSFEENRRVAREGGDVAGNARRDIEKRTGEPVITSGNAVDFAQLFTDVIEYKVDKHKKANKMGDGGNS
jgi:hypothetical protein